MATIHHSPAPKVELKVLTSFGSNSRRFIAQPILWFLSFVPITHGATEPSYDIVIYGGTSAGVIAAVQAKQLGKSVVIVGPDKHLGGLSSGGLGMTDTGNKAVIGGLARDFYHRIWKEYQKPETWRWQKPSEFGGRGQGTPAIDGEQRTMWVFEPHVAEKVFEDYVMEFQIPVYRDEWLDRANGVTKSGSRITTIRMLSGKSFSGKIFMDATYEGDLLATAGIDYHVGREANAVYGEQWNGVQVGVLHHSHHFGGLKQKISPYVIPNDPQSGLLPRISPDPPGEYGTGDKRVQAYCYRYCASNHPENRIPFPKPEGYDPKQYELMVRIFEAGWKDTFNKFDLVPNLKTDTNNHGPMSTDNIGMNYDYPEASYERRREILKEHQTYQQGWLYFVANDPRVPLETRTKLQSWGLPKDEFVDNGGWPHQIYVREARRMIGQFVMTENELMKKKPTPDSVGMGSYTIDSHNVQRYVTPEGYVQNEGDIGVGIRPYPIAYGALIPKLNQCENLFATICVSSSHIAYGSIRMEPVFMILGQSAATAASIAIDSNLAVQDVPYSTLRERLQKDGQVLEHASSAEPVKEKKAFLVPSSLPGIVVDDEDAILVGDWKVSSSAPSYVGNGYRHDQNSRDGLCSARCETKLPKAGRYEARLAYTPNSNRASNATVEILHAGGSQKLTIDQRKTPSINKTFVSLGVFDFDENQTAAILISNPGADGYVVIDAVQWVSQ
ncbi:MAG: FAD-dependent oxidoreductase [Pirellulaceae bacterium]|nr:FAD-dependent oxidoreductase [Pirellulaceae bacterium]